MVLMVQALEKHIEQLVALSFARPPSESTRNSATAVAATTSASSLQLSRRSDDRERARWHAFFALAVDFNC
jgi:hypothetical protein